MSIDLSVIAEIELVYKSSVKPSLRPKINSPQDAYEILLAGWDQNKIDFVEQFKVLLLNRGNKVLGIYEVSTGGVTATIADPRLVIIAALKANAVNIMLCHNHPSGSLNPSKADEELTNKIKQAALFHDITTLDHLIISRDEYFSFANEGYL